MPQFSVSLDKVVEKLRLEVVYTPTELKNIPIYTADVNRPGLLLTGYDEYFDPTRIQIFGNAEVGYLTTLPESERRSHIHTLFAAKPPALIVTRNLSVFDEVLEFASQYEVPVLRSTENTSSLMSALISNLSVEVAPRITRHGVLVEVYGEGILHPGRERRRQERDGRGARQARPPADRGRRGGAAPCVGPHDPWAQRRKTSAILSSCAAWASSMWRACSACGAVKMSEKVDLVVELEPWDKTKNYSRTGLETDTTDIMGIAAALHGDTRNARPQSGRDPGGGGHQQPPEKNGLQCGARAACPPGAGRG